MQDHSVILFTPLCVEGKVDIISVRGLIDILAMNLQTYPNVYVKAPLFIVDPELSNKKRKVLLWPLEYHEEEMTHLVQQCSDGITEILIPKAWKEEDDDKEIFHLQIQIRSLQDNFEIYRQEWQGSIVEIVQGFSQVATDIISTLGFSGQGQEKWPETTDKKTLKKFLKAITNASFFQAGISKKDYSWVIQSLMDSFLHDPGLDLAAYRLIGFLESLMTDPTRSVQIYQSALKALNKLEKMEKLPGPAHILIAEIYSDMKKWKKAESNLKRGVKKSPKNGEVIATMGNYYETQKDWKKAQETYESYLKICDDKNAYLVMHNLGAIYAEQGKFEQAVDLWCRSLKVYPNYPSAYGNLMNAYMELKEYGKMWVVFEEGLKRRPVPWHSYEYLLQNIEKIDSPEYAFFALNEYVENHPEDRGGYYHLALLHQITKNEQKALRYFKRGLKKGEGPEYLQATARRLLNIQIDKFEEQFDLACDNIVNGKADLAIDFFQNCNDLVPEFWPAWFLKAKSYQSMKRYDRALETLKKTCDLAPGHADIINELGVIATHVQDHDYAEKCFWQAVTMSPLHSEYLSNLALCLLKKGNLDQSRKIIQRALAIKSDDQVAQSIMDLTKEPVLVESKKLFSWGKKKKKRKKEDTQE